MNIKDFQNNQDYLVEEFLSYLANLDVKLWVESTKLRCNAPEEVLTPEIHAQLVARKTEIIAFLQQGSLDKNNILNSARRPISPVTRDTLEFVLSSAQTRLWLLDQLQGQSTAYNMPAAVEITGYLDRYAFARALKKIVSRHEVFHTYFHQVNGTPTQIIDLEATVNLPVIDLQNLPETIQLNIVKRLYATEAKKTFDLGKAPLLRVNLLQLNQDSNVLLLTMHHIISDAWSIGIFIKELSALYSAFVSEKPSSLKELPIQYVDFAVWQQKRIKEGIYNPQLNYWKKQLAGISPLLELPINRPRTAEQTFRGRSLQSHFSQELTEKLNTLSQKSGVTLFMTLMASFVTLLWRYTNQNDIPIGVPIANRNNKEIEALIGFFVNTLVLRTQIQDNPSFLQLLKQVQQTTLEAYEHQDIPFEQVLEALHPERNLSYNPLFQVMFTLQNAPSSELKLAGLTLNILQLETVTTKFDLTLSMEETPQGLIGNWEYNTDLFDEETIVRMADNLQTLLNAIVVNPEQPIKKLPLLNDEQKNLLIKTWNQTQTPYPSSKCVHHLFEEQAELTPDAVATVFLELFSEVFINTFSNEFLDQQITYSELNTRANKIAHCLIYQGVKPGVKVGVCIERSPEMILSILGILKAGGVYVPLDPTYPEKRLQYMVDDSQISLLLTQQHLTKILPKSNAKIICLDTNEHLLFSYSSKNPEIKIKSNNLAYIIYTSGSTGQPKGVSATHQGIVRLVKATNYISFDSNETFLQLAPISFDASTLEIWGSLLNGGKLVVMPKHTSSLEELGKIIGQYRVTTLWLTASLFHLMVDERLQDLRPIKQLLAGGDILSLTHVQKVLHNLKQCNLINGYGPTENTTFTCCAAIEAETITNETSVTIGRPIANTQVYILDSELQPVPIGIFGELYIGGDGLACNYHNRPELTAQKFIPNPFADKPGERLYKTGDLVRYLTNGNIEFLGRIDNQVKIRGFRIELGEIETTLSLHPQVRQVAVIPSSVSKLDKYLIAYIVPNQEPPTVTEIHNFLQQKLPSYMIPAAFVFLDTLPLTEVGKLDRSKLTVPDYTNNSTVDFVQPYTPTQQIIANIIANILQLQQVGIHDNFFDLGGHSLSASQVISRLKAAFNIELPLRYLFELPTVAQLDEYIYTKSQSSIGLLRPPIKPISGSRENLPLSWSQARLWFSEQLSRRIINNNIPVAVKITGNINIKAMEFSFKEIIRRHEILRTTYQTVDGEPVQVISPNFNINLPIIDLQNIPENYQSRIIEELSLLETEQPFNLTESPLLRATILQLAQQEHLLLLNTHHIASDGWSMGIFIKELSSLYIAFSQQKSSPLPELAIQYSDFTLWQKQWLSGETLDIQLKYWKQQLADSPSLLSLPTDRPRPQTQSYNVGTLNFELNQEITHQLKILSKESGSTLFMILLAAFATLLSRYSNQKDIIIGSPIANRNYSELESLIGLFVNTLALRVNLSEDPTFGSLLNQVRETTLKAYQHQDLPFEKLIQELNPERNFSYNPVFQVWFALQNVPMEDLQIPELNLKILPIYSNKGIFDLVLLLTEKPSGLEGVFQYSADLFNPETITQILKDFQTLLEKITANPQQKISNISLLPESQLNYYNPSDFPDAELNQKDLENLLAEINNPL